MGGVGVTGWLLGEWLPTLKKEEKEEIQKNLSSLLKNELSTTSIKRIKLSELPENLGEI